MGSVDSTFSRQAVPDFPDPDSASQLLSFAANIHNWGETVENMCTQQQ